MRYFLSTLLLTISAFGVEPDISITYDSQKISLIPSGKKKQEWIFESSKNLINWEHDVSLKPVLSGENTTSTQKGLGTNIFFRAQETEGFYDPRCLRVIDLNFEDNQWINQLTESYASGEES